jgi:hypothetical protein
MTKREEELPPLQKRIVLLLAEKGPLTRNEMTTKLKPPSTTKPILYAADSLTRKSLIEVVDQKKRAGREFPQYWLTARGLFFARQSGATGKALLKKTEEFFPEDKDKKIIAELISKIGELKNSELILRMIRTLYYPGRQIDIKNVFSLMLSAGLADDSKNLDFLADIYTLLQESPYGKMGEKILEDMSNKFENLKKRVTSNE